MRTFGRRVYDKLVREFGKSKKNPTNKTNFLETYPRLVAALKRSHNYDEAMRMAVGPEFNAIGLLERETLIHFGLKKNDYLIDVGCGSGRLARPLMDYLNGKYLGTDVVPELVAYAQKNVQRADWRFEAVNGLRIPEEDGRADMVCFFSVLTHLLHEESYIYLRDAKRVLKQGGRIVFSFLDFTIPNHWPIFEYNVEDVGINFHPLNMFISKDAIEVWATHLDLEVISINDGNVPYVPLQTPIVLESGETVEGMGTIGQSVCVLARK